MRFEEDGTHGQPTLFLSRRNLMTLLAKLDGHPADSYCSIHRNGLTVTAEEDDVHYTNRPAGQMHDDTEALISKPATGVEWA